MPGKKHRADMLTELINDVSDKIDEKLHIQEAFDYSLGLNVPKGHGSQTDRARHMKWMSENAQDYGENAARMMGLANEGVGLIKGVGKAITGKRPWSETWEETKRDLKTNEFAINFKPDDAQIEGIVQQLQSEEGTTEAPDPFTLYQRQQND